MIISKNLKINTTLPITKVVEINAITFEEKLSLDAFIALAEAYPDLRMEREKTGKVTIMSPVKFGTGKREIHVSYYLTDWWLKNGEKGEVFSASTGIILADTSFKSPDCGWISDERLIQNKAKEADIDFLRIAPDFVIEIRSFSDRIKKLKGKMTNSWMKNGVRLAWLIDPYAEIAYIYRENREVEEIIGFDNKVLSGEDILKGFELPLEKTKVK